MGSSDFYIDYNIEVSSVGDEFKRETERRLEELALSHSDMVGAAVALEKTADTQTYDLYRVRIVVYKRPQDIVVTKQDAHPMIALRDALDTLEEQVRTSREKLAQKDTHRDTQIETVYYELCAETDAQGSHRVCGSFRVENEDCFYSRSGTYGRIYTLCQCNPGLGSCFLKLIEAQGQREISLPHS